MLFLSFPPGEKWKAKTSVTGLSLSGGVWARSATGWDEFGLHHILQAEAPLEKVAANQENSFSAVQPIMSSVGD